MIDDNGGGGIRMFIDDDKKTTNAFTLLMCAGLKQDKISKEEWRGLIRRKESKRLPY